VQRLLQVNADVSHRALHNITAMHVACNIGHPPSVSLLLQANLDLHYSFLNRKSCLELSNNCSTSANMKLYSLASCLKAKADLGLELGNQCILLARQHGHVEVTQLHHVPAS
jgi:ankyrin repeat protein